MKTARPTDSATIRIWDGIVAMDEETEDVLEFSGLAFERWNLDPSGLGLSAEDHAFEMGLRAARHPLTAWIMPRQPGGDAWLVWATSEANLWACLLRARRDFRKETRTQGAYPGKEVSK